MAEINVLITGAGTATCQSVIKGLRSQNELKVRVITTDTNPGNAGRFFSDSFYKVPLAAQDDFIPAMLDICRKEKVHLLIPIVDYEFEKLAASKQDFERDGCKVALSGSEVIKTATDKWLTYNFFRQINIPTPQTFLKESIPAGGIRFPVIIKPRILGRGSLNTFKTETKAQMDDAISRMPEALIQELKNGEEFTVDTLSDFTGKCLGAVVRQRIEIKSGVSYKGVTVKDERILNQVVRIVESLPVLGPANVQCFKSDDEISFIEINPRFSGTLVLSLAAGFNSPLSLVKLAMGLKPDSDLGSYREGIMMYRYWQEVFTDENGNPFRPLKL